MEFKDGDNVKIRGSETFGTIEAIRHERRPEYGRGETIIYYVRLNDSGKILEYLHTEIKKMEGNFFDKK